MACIPLCKRKAILGENSNKDELMSGEKGRVDSIIKVRITKTREVDFVSSMINKISTIITPHLAKKNISANQVTILRFIIFIPLAVLFFIYGNYYAIIAGIICYSLFIIFDYVDGDLARLKKETTLFGAWLEHVFDMISEGLIVLAISFGTYRVTKVDYVWIFGSVALYGIGMRILLYNELENKYNLYHLFSGIYIKKIKNLSGLERFFAEILMPYRQPFKTLFYSIYPIIIFGLFNQLYLSLIIIAIMNNIRWLVIFYALFELNRKNENQPLFIKIIKEMPDVDLSDRH
jgi:phosphatidylglycerophosphate synthase